MEKLAFACVLLLAFAHTASAFCDEKECDDCFTVYDVNKTVSEGKRQDDVCWEREELRYCLDQACNGGDLSQRNQDALREIDNILRDHAIDCSAYVSGVATVSMAATILTLMSGLCLSFASSAE